MKFWVVTVEAEASHARVSTLAFRSREDAENWVLSRSDNPVGKPNSYVYWGEDHTRYELFLVETKY